MDVQERRTRARKVNPDCAADRHKPAHESYTRGCRCPETILAHEQWEADGGRKPPAGRPRAGTRLVPEDPSCTAYRHNGSQQSWCEGCRCPSTRAAHERYLAERAEKRQLMRELAANSVAVGCPAVIHGTVRARMFGCTHIEAERKYRAWLDSKTEARRRARELRNASAQGRWLKWHGPRRQVSSINLWMLVRGMRDAPTMAEQVAAVAILSQRGSITTGRLTDIEIGARIGVHPTEVTRLRHKRVQWRKERTHRRLAEAAYKAVRVARASA